MKFNKVKNIFISNMHPDFFGGFPGFYLSSREATVVELKNFRISVHGPVGLRKAVYAGRPFIGTLTHLETVEFKSQLEQ